MKKNKDIIEIIIDNIIDTFIGHLKYSCFRNTKVEEKNKEENRNDIKAPLLKSIQKAKVTSNNNRIVAVRSFSKRFDKPKYRGLKNFNKKYLNFNIH